MSRTAYAPIGKTDEYGEVLVMQYLRKSKHEVFLAILEDEGPGRTLEERLANLGWRIAQVEITEVK